MTCSSRHFLLILLAILLVFGLYPLAGLILQQDNYGLASARAAPQFELFDVQGRHRSLADYRGRYLYLMFGYMRCDNVCHVQVMQLAALADILHDSNVEFLYLAMDTRHDEPSLLRAYFDQRGENFSSLHAGNMRQMQTIASAFNAGYRIDGNPAAEDYGIEHPARIFLIDPQGRLRFIYSGASIDAEKVADDFQRLDSGSRLTL